MVEHFVLGNLVWLPVNSYFFPLLFWVLIFVDSRHVNIEFQLACKWSIILEGFNLHERIRTVFLASVYKQELLYKLPLVGNNVNELMGVLSGIFVLCMEWISPTVYIPIRLVWLVVPETELKSIWFISIPFFFIVELSYTEFFTDEL